MPTQKQKLAVDNLVESRGSVSSAMRKAGYTNKSAKNPKNLTESKGWAELMEEKLPDKLLVNKHKELLTVPIKIKLRTRQRGNIIDEEETKQLDTFAISKGLEMAYKLKGHYKEDKVGSEKAEVKITQNILNVIVKAEDEVYKELKKGNLD